MTDTKQELLALIDRLDPERQTILLQYARGLEQAGHCWKNGSRNSKSPKNAGTNRWDLMP
ncbi:MAG: hypothetical protein BroJett018_54020 [Chloroflexota bacterium]|nr:MAG: hypothetical protein BroJett018_54020 [Chloroflexota bacterium]